jgi:hypothetical protein
MNDRHDHGHFRDLLFDMFLVLLLLLMGMIATGHVLRVS